MTQHWINLIASLKENNCVLLLGPSLRCVKVNKHKISVNESLGSFISRKLNDVVNIAAEETGRYRYIIQLLIKSQSGFPIRKNDIDDYVRQHLSHPSSIHQLLARLPFNTVINLSPDNLMAQALRREGKSISEANYNYKGREGGVLTIQNTQEAVGERDLLVYNLFGSFSDPDSLILTEKQQLEYVKNLISKNPSLPNNLLSRISNTKSYIFLGFDFNDWYFRIVLDALKLPKPPVSIVSRSAEKDIAILNKTFYSEEFGFEFVEFDTETFIRELIKQYKSKYGADSLTRRKKVAFLYDLQDSNHVENIKVQLNFARTLNRAELIDLSKLDVGEINNEIKSNISEADVIVSFLRVEYVMQGVFREMLEHARKLNNSRLIYILTGPGVFETIIPNLDQDNLISDNGRPLGPKSDPGIYYLISWKINSSL